MYKKCGENLSLTESTNIVPAWNWGKLIKKKEMHEAKLNHF